MKSARVVVSIDDLGMCDCGEIVTQPGIWGVLAHGVLGLCDSCGARLLPVHFGIMNTEYGPERQCWLNTDGKWTETLPLANFQLDKWAVELSSMNCKPRPRWEHWYNHLINKKTDLEIRWRAWSRVLRGKSPKIS